MSIPHVPEPCRLIVSVLTAQKEVADSALPGLTRELGPLENEIGPLAFDFTTYYDEELGTGVRRWLWVFSDLRDRGELARIKCLTNEVEQSYTVGGKRRFNLDPGAMSLENFILATGKNRAHRIYLQDGIFAELTLIFQGISYRPVESTFPDYRDPEMIDTLNKLREIYKCKLRGIP